MNPVNFPGLLEVWSILGNQDQLAKVRRHVRACQIFSLANFWIGEVGQVVRFVNLRFLRKNEAAWYRNVDQEQSEKLNLESQSLFSSKITKWLKRKQKKYLPVQKRRRGVKCENVNQPSVIQNWYSKIFVPVNLFARLNV